MTESREFDDDTLTDAVERLKSRYFKLLIFITGQTLISLLLSNLVISIESDKNRLLVTFLMNVTQVSYVVNLGVIAYFIFDVIAPKRIERASRDLQKEVEPDLDKEAKGSLENFLKNFNQIEYILQNMGKHSSRTSMVNILNIDAECLTLGWLKLSYKPKK
ncbi:hypothetical protein HC02_27745 [Vibrio parahaemolyticus]|nr:hypothetical protein HC02_27745 [Vibrio parahaemolyticus]